VDCEPVTALVPDQLPDAVHEVAFVADQLSVAEPPELIALGLAVSVTTGTNLLTVTVAEVVAEPLSPVQLTV
jgi:hypothetical protein